VCGIWLKHPTLFIEGYRLVWNKKFLKADGDELHYFYCSNKGRFKCKKSGKAMKSEEDAFILYGYAGQHSEECRPSSAVLHIPTSRRDISWLGGEGWICPSHERSLRNLEARV